MSGTATIFGRSGPADLAKSVMESASLGALPSPQEPADLLSDSLLKAYQLVDYAVMAVRKVERDPMHLATVASFAGFVAERVNELDDAQSEAGPPAPPAPPPGSALPPGAAAPGAPAGGAPTPVGASPSPLGSSAPPPQAAA